MLGLFRLSAMMNVSELMFVIPVVMLVIFEIWMLVDLVRNRRLRGSAKILWALGILIFQPVGAIVYYFTARKQ